MRIKVVLWGAEPLSLEHLNVIRDISTKRYYEKAALDLYEYVQVSKAQINLLYKEISYKWDKIILCLLDKRSSEETEVIEALQEKWPQLLNVCYIPGMKADELMHLFPVFLSLPKKAHQKEHFHSLKGSTVIMGHEEIKEGFGKLVQHIFKKWQYVSHLEHVKIQLYSWQEINIVGLSELEDIFSDYIGERARLEVEWYKSQKENNEMYFLIEGNQINL